MKVRSFLPIYYKNYDFLQFSRKTLFSYNFVVCR